MKIALVGFGAMGQNHARVAAELGVLAAVVEPAKDLAQKAAKAYGLPVVDNLHQLPNDVQGAIIATPTATHVSLASEALTRGLHVLIEKPIAGTMRDAEKMVDQARSTGLTLAVGHVERHNPVVRWAKETLGSGQVGQLLSMSSRRVSSFPGRIRDVGCILDIGIHEIDASLYLVGSQPKSVFARGGSYKAKGFEDHAMIQIGFANGMSASIEANWLTPRRIRQATMTCTDGLVEFDYMAQTATISRSAYLPGAGPADYNPAVEFDVRQFTMKRQEPLRNEIQDFIEAATKKRPPLVDGAAGLAALQVAEAALASMRTGRAVDLEG